MAISAARKADLLAALVELKKGDYQAVAAELYLGFYETAAERKTRAKTWYQGDRDGQAALLAGADAANTARKATLTATIQAYDDALADVTANF